MPYESGNSPWIWRSCSSSKWEDQCWIFGNKIHSVRVLWTDFKVFYLMIDSFNIQLDWNIDSRYFKFWPFFGGAIPQISRKILFVYYLKKWVKIRKVIFLEHWRYNLLNNNQLMITNRRFFWLVLFFSGSLYHLYRTCQIPHPDMYLGTYFWICTDPQNFWIFISVLSNRNSNSKQ